MIYYNIDIMKNINEEVSTNDQPCTIKNLKLIFSLVTGQTYTVEEDEVKNLDEYQVPLKKPFPKYCKACFGRGYIGRRCVITSEGTKPTDHLSFCTKCLRKCIDKAKG